MNDKLKYNIKTNQNNKENTLDLQLFSSVSNPYTFTLDGNYNINATIESALVDLSYYARDNISGYQSKRYIPQENLDYLQSGLVATNMQSMFEECRMLPNIPNLNIDTSRCTNMNSMFYNCQFLYSVDISNFDTSNVTDIGYMFSGCTQMSSLDLSNFDTSNVTNMKGIFYGCRSLISIDISNWDTSKATSMYGLFGYCEKLELDYSDLSHFNTSNVEDMQSMFYCDYKLTSLDLSKWNTSKLTNVHQMFRGCDSLTSLNISNWNTSNITDMEMMFYYCSSLTTITGTIDMKSCKYYDDMFKNCSKLTGVKIKNPPAGFNGAGLNSSQYTIVS